MSSSIETCQAGNALNAVPAMVRATSFAISPSNAAES
jgi:hypothetical protein